MNVRWKKLLLQTTIWLVTEMALGQVGLDALADYSEYTLEKKYLLSRKFSLSNSPL